MIFKIEGLDEFQKDLKDAQAALAELNGELGSITFDPEDPFSIEAAIAASADMIDQKIGHYSANPLIGPMAEDLKNDIRQGIIDQAAALRLGEQGEVEDGESS